MARRTGPQQRLTLCTSCGGPLLIDVSTKSTSCPACNQRVITEPLTINDYVAVRQLKVANRVEIGKKGFVVAGVRCDELKIVGRLQGSAVVLKTVQLGKKAEVRADIRATHIKIEPGARLEGELRIGPTQMPELEKAARFARELARKQEGARG